MKIMVCGHARHGKDQFCEYMGLSYKSSSQMALEKVIWQDHVMRKFYSTPEECFNDRANHRKEWYDLIKAYNTPDLTRLTRDILSENDVYCGLRDREEFLRAREEGLFDLSIWVDASGRLPPEEGTSCTLLPTDCDIIVTNNGTLEELETKACAIARCLTPSLVADPNPTASIQAIITKWADEVFPERTITNAISKMVLEEIPEYLQDQHNAMELGDLGILLYDIANLAGVDLDQAIRDKMAINRARTWAISPETGLMNHVKGDDK